MRVRLIDADARLKKGQPTTSIQMSGRLRSLYRLEEITLLQPVQEKGTHRTFLRNKGVCFNWGRHFKREWPRNRTRETNPPNASSAVPFVAGDLSLTNFIVDSGATHHMCSRKDWFSNFQDHTGTVQCASKTAALKVTGMGDIKGETSKGLKIILKEVLFVPNISGQLISVKSIEHAGFSVMFKNEKIYAQSDVQKIHFAPVVASMYAISLPSALPVQPKMSDE
ncbi:hypothetical protein JTE90_028596 [Oedothorax gibbosus]|uniref:Retrovirus-related Pol polyprotein from transposon TNT 1-94-like beta-barrel domain-containing protein n=1 Tax=Oedothorax gibbosus TaxID=931172 RepID=A0AAV6TXQ0_9ARAC|nr:hypothetical protein JTE90_028596 [Oedothorax gibbosus]